MVGDKGRGDGGIIPLSLQEKKRNAGNNEKIDNKNSDTKIEL